jgi:peptide deformylase
MKRIVHSPNPILTSPSKPVVRFDNKLTRLIQELKSAIRATHNPRGVGLAAPQIGMPYRIFITQPKTSDDIRVFINPKIIEASKDVTEGISERENKLEGCLSIPAVWGKVKRAQTLTLLYQDEKGTKKREIFSGFMATIIQHETDHVNGVLFTQRVLEQKGKLYQAATDTEGKEVLEEIALP